MVQLKVRMLLCDTGNKRQKSKCMSSLALCILDDKFSAVILHRVSMAVHQSIQLEKLSIPESLWSSGTAQLGGGELKSCLLLTLYCDTQQINLTQTVISTPTHLQSYGEYLFSVSLPFLPRAKTFGSSLS